MAATSKQIMRSKRLAKADKKSAPAEWMYSVLKSPLVTEKTTQIAEKGNWVSFEVAMTANKPDIRESVESLYNVDVLRVNTLIQKGKVKGFGGRKGRRSDMKKAFVKLKEGQNIDLSAGL